MSVMMTTVSNLVSIGDATLNNKIMFECSVDNSESSSDVISHSYINRVTHSC